MEKKAISSKLTESKCGGEKEVISIARRYAERSMVLWFMPPIPIDKPKIELIHSRATADEHKTIIILLIFLVLREGNPGSRPDSRELSVIHHSYSIFSFTG